MAVELHDLRAKVTPEAHAVISAVAAATGADFAEVVRGVLHEWAEKQIHVARHVFGALPGLTPITVDLPRGYVREPMKEALRNVIYARDNGLCQYCNAPLRFVEDSWHIDHVVPVCRGGSNDPVNLVLACVPCNLKKGSGDADGLKVV